jgi:hypothetical protein
LGWQPPIRAALRHPKTVSAAAGALVQHYVLPADKYGQSRYRAGLGAAWGARLHDGRRATDGYIEAHIHVHGNAHKVTVKTKGAIEAKLHRWPTMSDFS